MILALGFGAWKWLGKPVEPPKPEVQERMRLKTERLVLKSRSFPVVVKSQGTVRAHHSTTVTALVPGTISAIHSCFEDGAFFKTGDVLAELDPADMQAALTSAEARLARAEAAHAQEEAKAKQAKLNWDDIGFNEKPSPLVLRIPQLKEAEAAVTAAKADLEQAIRNLERTKIRAPFDGRVKARMIGLGQAVGGTTPLGEIFTTDFAEVRLPLTAEQIGFVNLPTHEGDKPVDVRLIDALGNPNKPSGNVWQARIVRTEGALDETSRELFAIARIDDPFGLDTDHPELRIGQPIRAEISGITLDDVFVLPRSAIRGLNLIYRIDPEDLLIERLAIDPVWNDGESLVVREGLVEGDWIAVSMMPYAPNRAPVDIIERPVLGKDLSSPASPSDS